MHSVISHQQSICSQTAGLLEFTKVEWRLSGSSSDTLSTFKIGRKTFFFDKPLGFLRFPEPSRYTLLVSFIAVTFASLCVWKGRYPWNNFFVFTGLHFLSSQMPTGPHWSLFFVFFDDCTKVKNWWNLLAVFMTWHRTNFEFGLYTAVNWMYLITMIWIKTENNSQCFGLVFSVKCLEMTFVVNWCYANKGE